MLKEYFIVLQGVSFDDTAQGIFPDWHFHINLTDLSGSENHTKLGSFRRGGIRFVIFAVAGLDELPSMNQMKRLVAWQYDYMRNPFGKNEDYWQWRTS